MALPGGLLATLRTPPPWRGAVSICLMRRPPGAAGRPGSIGMP